MRRQLIGIPLTLFVSLLILLAGRGVSFAVTQLYCAALHNECRAYCGRINDATAAAGCYQECRENYERCRGSASPTANELSPFPNPRPPKRPGPGRVKPPPLKGTTSPPKLLGPVRVNPPVSVSNPGSSNPTGGTIESAGPHHGKNKR
jgi:hypothetical protein